MTQFLALLKIEHKNKKQTLAIKNKTLQLFLSSLFFLLKKVIIILPILFLTRRVLNFALANTLEIDFLIIVVLIAQVLQFFVALNQILKTQQNVKEVTESFMMPVKNETLFLSKITFIYFKHLLAYITALAPVLIIWGIMTLQVSSFYIKLLPILLLLPIIPILLASFFAFPLFKLISFLKANFYINFIVFSLIIAFGFYFYIEVLKMVIQVFQNQSIGLLSLSQIAKLQSITSKLYFCVLFKNLLTGFAVFKSFVVLVSIFLLCFICVFYLAKTKYRNIIWKVADNQLDYGTKTTKIRKLPTTINLLLKEFKIVFRNYNHSFSFFIIGLTTPLLVFFSSKALSELSFAQTNISIYPAITLFLLLIFLTLTTSFSATTISREGSSFIVAKIMPIKPIKQIKAKVLFYMLIEFVAVFASVLALYLVKLITFLDFVLILIISLIVAYGTICGNVNLDIKKQSATHKDKNTQNNPLTNINVSKGMISSLTFAVLIGFLAIFLSFVLRQMWWYFPIFALAFLHTIIKHFKLFKNLNKKYYEIEI